MIVPRILSHLKYSRNKFAWLLLATFLLLSNLFLASCTSSSGGSSSSSTATATPSELAIAQLRWCGKPSILKACDYCGLAVLHWALLKGSSIVLIAYISVLRSLASRVSDFFSNIGFNARSSFALKIMLDRVPITVTTPGFFCDEEEPRSRYSR